MELPFFIYVFTLYNQCMNHQEIGRNLIPCYTWQIWETCLASSSSIKAGQLKDWNHHD
jgi:hypothetical protein